MSNHPSFEHNVSDNEHFDDVLQRGLASPHRRLILKGGFGLASVATLPMLAACGGGSDSGTPLPASSSALPFPATAKSLADAVVVPPGYTVSVLHATGDRLNNSISSYSNQGVETDDWSNRVGDHHDGMHLFYIGATMVATVKSRSLITGLEPSGSVIMLIWTLSPMFRPFRSTVRDSGMSVARQIISTS